MKTKVFVKDMILPAFWLLFFLSFSSSKIVKADKTVKIKKVENNSTSSEAINSYNNNKNSIFQRAAIYISNL